MRALSAAEHLAFKLSAALITALGFLLFNIAAVKLDKTPAPGVVSAGAIRSQKNCAIKLGGFGGGLFVFGGVAFLVMARKRHL